MNPSWPPQYLHRLRHWKFPHLDNYPNPHRRSSENDKKTGTFRCATIKLNAFRRATFIIFLLLLHERIPSIFAISFVLYVKRAVPRIKIFWNTSSGIKIIKCYENIRAKYKFNYQLNGIMKSVLSSKENS